MRRSKLLIMFSKMNLMRAVTRISPVNMWSNEAFSKLTSPEQFGKPYKVEICFVNDPHTGMQYRMETSYIFENGDSANEDMSLQCKQVPGLVPANTSSLEDDRNVYFLNVPKEIKNSTLPSGIQNILSNKLGSKISSLKEGRRKLPEKKTPSESDISKKLLEPLLQYFIENECLICGFIALYESDLDSIKHMTTHVRHDSYFCDCCRKPYISASELYKHKIDRSKKKPYVCEVCGKKFKRNYFLTSHIRSDHVALPPSTIQQRPAVSSIEEPSQELMLSVFGEFAELKQKSDKFILNNCPQSKSSETYLINSAQVKPNSEKSALVITPHLEQKCDESALVTTPQLEQKFDKSVLVLTPLLEQNSDESVLVITPQMEQKSDNSFITPQTEQKCNKLALTIACPLEPNSNTSLSTNSKEKASKTGLRNSPKSKHASIISKCKQTPSKSALLFSSELNKKQKQNNFLGSEKYFSEQNKLTNPAFRCTICHRKFTSLKFINDHRRCHGGIERFKCLICFKHFFNSGVLKHHSHVKLSRASSILSKQKSKMLPVKKHSFKQKSDLSSKLLPAKSSLNNFPQLQKPSVSSNSSPSKRMLTQTSLSISLPSKLLYTKSPLSNTPQLKSIKSSPLNDPSQSKLVTIKSPTQGLSGSSDPQLSKKHGVLSKKSDSRVKKIIQPAFGCTICHRKFNSLQFIGDHRRCHGGIERFKCLICFKHFFNSGILKHHHHMKTISNNLRCKTCKKFFPSITSLEEHNKCHKKKQLFSCPICNEKFYLESKLLKHKKSAHHNLYGLV